MEFILKFALLESNVTFHENCRCGLREERLYKNWPVGTVCVNYSIMARCMSQARCTSICYMNVYFCKLVPARPVRAVTYRLMVRLIRTSIALDDPGLQSRARGLWPSR